MAAREELERQRRLLRELSERNLSQVMSPARMKEILPAWLPEPPTAAPQPPTSPPRPASTSRRSSPAKRRNKSGDENVSPERRAAVTAEATPSHTVDLNTSGEDARPRPRSTSRATLRRRRHRSLSVSRREKQAARNPTPVRPQATADADARFLDLVQTHERLKMGMYPLECISIIFEFSCHAVFGLPLVFPLRARLHVQQAEGAAEPQAGQQKTGGGACCPPSVRVAIAVA